MKEVCFKCGIGKNLVIFTNFTYICTNCLGVLRMKEKRSNKV